MTAFLQVHKLGFHYNQREEIIKDVSFNLDLGESLGIIGPNGGGKSTLMKNLAGLLTPSTGSIQIGEYRPGKGAYPRQLVSYVPQGMNINPVIPVKISDIMQFEFMAAKNPLSIDEATQIVGLSKSLDDLFVECSGGEKQRVLLARALIKRPRLLLLDEPTTGLDSKGQDQLMELVGRIKHELKTAVVIVDHNINQVLKHCDKLICLNRSTHWHEPKDLLTKEILEDIYHCELEHMLIHEKDVIADHHECDHHHDMNEHQEGS